MKTVPLFGQRAQAPDPDEYVWVRVVTRRRRRDVEAHDDRVDSVVSPGTAATAQHEVRRCGRTMPACAGEGRHRAAQNGWSLATQAMAGWAETLRALLLVCVPLTVIGAIVLALELYTTASGIPVSVPLTALAVWRLLRRGSDRQTSLRTI